MTARFLPSKDRKYLLDRQLAFEEVADGSVNGIIFPDFKLPSKQFDRDTASILILLPSGYPDLAPDMFYLNPWVRLAATNNYARCTDQPYTFNCVTWQRGSRHNNEWRRGKDGIWTMLKRVENALQEAE